MGVRFQCLYFTCLPTGMSLLSTVVSAKISKSFPKTHALRMHKRVEGKGKTALLFFNSPYSPFYNFTCCPISCIAFKLTLKNTSTVLL